MSLAAFSLVRRVPAVNVRRLGITPVALAVALTSVPLGALTFQVLRSSYFEYLSNGPGKCPPAEPFIAGAGPDLSGAQVVSASMFYASGGARLSFYASDSGRLASRTKTSPSTRN